MGKDYEDDGRTLADMSGIGRRLPEYAPEPKKSAGEGEAEELGGAETLAAVAGALKAALLIGLAFLAGIGIFILILTHIW